MQIDIPAHIERLLFLHDALIIPGFGGFTATRTPATADYAGGTVNPPSKTLAFSENLTVDDGILVDDIARTHAIGVEDAQRAVAEFVARMQALLGQREIVTLPGVGRLYQNYVQKIQFLPDSTNFNAASYGLPPLQFSPIARSREVQQPAVAGAEQAPTAPPATASLPDQGHAAPRRSGGRWGAWLGLLLLLFSLGAGIWYWQQQKKKNLPDRDAANNEQVAKSPREKPAADAPKSDAADTPTVEQPTAGQPMRECILLVATLREKSNADKLLDLLKREGHEVYFLEKNGYQVGVRFQYSKYAEVQETINILRQQTGEHNIFVKKK